VRTNDSYDPAFGRVRRANSKRQRKQYNDQDTFAKRDRHVERLATGEDAAAETDDLPTGDRWSTWDQSVPTERGPKPHPKWLVTELAAVDHELGVLKTGKEADVFLVRRGVPGTDRSCLLAAKRYRDATHRQFHRDAGYLEGRRVRESRVNRAVANRSEFGRQAIAGQWAYAEFNALVQLYNAGLPVPYPVQILRTEILLEFIGDADGTGAPRLAETRPELAELASLWSQLVEAMATLASVGFAHGDLSPYNLLVHHGRLVLIDLPQVVDVISHPDGRSFLERDAKNVATWFVRAGQPDADPETLARLLAEEARLALAASVYSGRKCLFSPETLISAGTPLPDESRRIQVLCPVMWGTVRKVRERDAGRELRHGQNPAGNRLRGETAPRRPPCRRRAGRRGAHRGRRVRRVRHAFSVHRRGSRDAELPRLGRRPAAGSRSPAQ
jgi:RIO kinase 1